MEYSCKFRIYPTKEQENLIQRTFRCCRFIYNRYLARWSGDAAQYFLQRYRDSPLLTGDKIRERVTEKRLSLFLGCGTPAGIDISAFAYDEIASLWEIF